MQPIVEHPDALTNHPAVKAITRGSRQSADDAAIEAYWQAIEQGKSAEGAEAIFSDTYYKIVSNGNVSIHISKP